MFLDWLKNTLGEQTIKIRVYPNWLPGPWSDGFDKHLDGFNSIWGWKKKPVRSPSKLRIFCEKRPFSAKKSIFYTSNRIIRMRIFFSFQKVWSPYYCMSLSRSRIMRSFFTSVQTKMPTSIFARDRIQLYLAKMAIFDKMTKWPYLSPEVPNPKNKGTFLSSTLKVEESKVPLFFGLEAPGQIYGPFLFFLIWLQIIAFIKMTKWPYLSPEVPNPKIKALSFLQL